MHAVPDLQGRQVCRCRGVRCIVLFFGGIDEVEACFARLALTVHCGCFVAAWSVVLSAIMSRGKQFEFLFFTMLFRTANCPLSTKPWGGSRACLCGAKKAKVIGIIIVTCFSAPFVIFNACCSRHIILSVYHLCSLGHLFLFCHFVVLKAKRGRRFRHFGRSLLYRPGEHRTGHRAAHLTFIIATASVALLILHACGSVVCLALVLSGCLANACLMFAFSC